MHVAASSLGPAGPAKSTQVLEIAGVLLLCLFTLSTVLRPEPGFRAVFDTWLYSSIGVVATGSLAWRAWAFADRERGAWAALALALGLFSVGNLSWGILFAGLDEPPFPSWSDAAWLGFYPFAYIAVVKLLRVRHPGTPAALWLDGLTAGLGMAALAAALAFDVIAEKTTGSPLVIAFGLAYPLGDLVLICLVGVAFALSGWRPDRAWLLLGIGILGHALADTAFLFRQATGSYIEGTALDALWPWGAMWMAMAAWRPHQTELREDVPSVAPVLVPALFAATAVVLLVYDHVARQSLVAVLLAAGSLLAGLARLALTVRQVESLAIARVEARIDELTHLGNRRAFYESVNSWLAGREPRATGVLLLMDLDAFKVINDTFGHPVGDELLQQAARRLDSICQPGDSLARLGGDEFALFVTGAGGSAATRIALEIGRKFNIPFAVDGVPVRVSASIGVALCPEHGDSVSLLLRRADVAMYQAKQEKSGHAVYSRGRDDHSRERLLAIEELRRAIEEHQLVVHYQPKVGASDERIVGAEALVRWQHPGRGLLGPAHFLGTAERANLMAALTREVLDLVLTDMAHWEARGVRLHVAVNLSVTNLLDRDFVGDVEQAVLRHGIDPHHLYFEITEEIILADPERARSAVEALRALGARVSLDDYGTGYSSMSYLRQLPLDELKLDRSFITGLGSDPTAATFVSTARQLADALGLKLVAEGVETLAAWDAVRRIGCDLGQGYLFSRPVEATELIARVLAGDAIPTGRMN